MNRLNAALFPAVAASLAAAAPASAQRSDPYGRIALDTATAPAQHTIVPGTVTRATFNMAPVRPVADVTPPAVPRDVRPPQPPARTTKKEAKDKEVMLNPDEALPEVLQAAALAGRNFAETFAAVKRDYAALKEALSRHEKAPDFNVYKEEERVRLLEQFVTNGWLLGKIVLTKEAELRGSIARFLLAAKEAVPRLTAAAGYYEAQAVAARFEETRQRRQEIAEWYRARAERARLHMERASAADLEKEEEKLREMVEDLRVFRLVLRSDPFFIGEDDADLTEQLDAFLQTYDRLGQVLGQWTKVLEVPAAEPGRR